MSFTWIWPLDKVTAGVEVADCEEVDGDDAEDLFARARRDAEGGCCILKSGA